MSDNSIRYLEQLAQQVSERSRRNSENVRNAAERVKRQCLREAERAIDVNGGGLPEQQYRRAGANLVKSYIEQLNVSLLVKDLL